MDEALISLQKVTKVYGGGTRALNEVTLSFEKDEWTTIMGPSGSGKTTLLNIIGCLDQPTSGIVRIAGKEVTGVGQAALTRLRRENVGLVFQQYHLVPYLTALENVMLAQYYHGSLDETKAVAALKNVGLEHRLGQRTCLAVNSSGCVSQEPSLTNQLSFLPMSRPGTSIKQTGISSCN